ncbi:MAG: type II toxin-antitoxin system RatA family toxin [Alteromonadaceae bacterium]|nr:type II toxin-antitoxin system RatA family toxin [Alteromonadaceae bacterium]
MAHQIDKTALVMHSAEQMFRLVNDTNRYPEFLPWCTDANVHEEADGQRRASLKISKGGMHHWFTTRNRVSEPERIELELVDGPFKHLTGLWQFQRLDDNACKVVLTLNFEFSGSLARMAFGPVFKYVANAMVDAFCRRADEIYGRG